MPINSLIYKPVTYTPINYNYTNETRLIINDIEDKIKDILVDDFTFSPYNFSNVSTMLLQPIEDYVDDVQQGYTTTQEAATEIATAYQEDTRSTKLPSSQKPLLDTKTDYDVTKRLEQLLSDNGVKVRITSDYREGAKTKQGKDSYHSQKDQYGRSMAYDIVPLNGNYEELKHAFVFNPEIRNWMLKNGMGILEETTPGALLRTGGSGNHWHIGKDRSALTNYSEMIKTFENKYPNEKTNLHNILKPGVKEGSKEYRLFNDLKDTKWYSSEELLKQYLPLITRYYNILTVLYKLDPKQAAGILGNLMAENTKFDPDLGTKYKGLALNSIIIQDAIKKKYGDYSGDSLIKWIGDYVTGKLLYDPSTLGYRSKEYMQAHTNNNYSAGQSAYHFGRNYERFVGYNVKEDNAAYTNRKKAAEALYKYFN